MEWLDRGFYTARGWHHSADFAALFTKPEVDQFISERADDVLVPIHYDPQVAHNDTIRVIGHKTESTQNHDLNKVTLAALTELESHHGASDLRVEVVRHEVAEVPEAEHLTSLVQQAVTALRRQRRVSTEPIEVVRRMDVALARFDVALDEYKKRFSLIRHIDIEVTA